MVKELMLTTVCHEKTWHFDACRVHPVLPPIVCSQIWSTVEARDSRFATMACRIFQSPADQIPVSEVAGQACGQSVFSPLASFSGDGVMAGGWGDDSGSGVDDACQQYHCQHETEDNHDI
jgi:hypothetical protein